MSELKPCPFCGGEAKVSRDVTCGYETFWVHCLECHSQANYGHTEAEAIAVWNTRAAMEFDGWFYLPKPKEPIVEVTETTNTWDGTKVRTDVFYQVQKQAIANWAKDLDEYIIKRICEVWDTRAERTCHAELNEDRNAITCSECGSTMLLKGWEEFHDWTETTRISTFTTYPHCPNCGARVVSE